MALVQSNHYLLAMTKRSEKTAIYLIVQPTGQFDDDGVEIVVVLDVKLTSASADHAIEKSYPGAKKEKWFADKRTE